jgi:glutaredoxin
MMSRPVLAVSAIVTVCFAAVASAQMYRWVDKDGKVHYTDAPPPGVKSVEKKMTTPNVAGTSQVPYATQAAAKNFPVTLYTAKNCNEPCKDARSLLAKRGVPFREVAVADERSRAELKKVSGAEQVPVITVGKNVTAGFEPEMWHNALDAGGYPRSAGPLPAQAPQPPVAKSESKQPETKEPETAQPKGPYAPR